MAMVLRWSVMLVVCGALGCSRSEPKSPPAPTPAPSPAAVEATPDPSPGTPPIKEVKESEVPKGSPANVSSAASLQDDEGVALVPAEGPISAEVLHLFLSQPMPIPGWVAGTFGAAEVPDADGQPIRDLLASVAADRAALEGQRATIRGRVQAIIKAGKSGELPKGKPLSRGLPSLDPVASALDAAKVTVFPEPSPLLGGADQGMAVAAVALIFAARVADAVVARDGTEAFVWSRRMARFGALVAAQARTLGELTGAVVAVQDALAMIEVSGYRDVAVLPNGKTGVVADARTPRKRLGSWATSLTRVGKLFRDPVDVDLWTRVAREQPDPLWRHEAIRALFMEGAFHRERASSEKARQSIEAMSKDGGKGLSEVAAHWLKRLALVQ